MIIEDYRIVTLKYEVRDGGPTGSLLERMDANYPFIFMFGVGQMLAAWERQLYGLKPHTGFTFLLPPEMAYGMPSAAYILEVPSHYFNNPQEQMSLDTIEAGQYITLTGSDGKPKHGKILSWNDKSVKVDCNHALAGKSLFFSGAILDVRAATTDELIQKKYLKTE